MIDIALLAAVPLWIEHVRRMSPLERALLAERSSRTIAFGEKRDALRGQHGAGPALLACGEQARGANEGGPAAVFNAMAAGLALLAFNPGGVDYGGQHWEARS